MINLFQFVHKFKIIMFLQKWKKCITARPGLAVIFKFFLNFFSNLKNNLSYLTKDYFQQDNPPVQIKKFGYRSYSN